MTAIVGNAGALKLNGQVVAELRNWTLEMTSDTIETTNMGDATRQYVKGLASFSGSADAYFDPAHFAATGSGGNNIDGLIFGSVGDAGVTAVLYPEGDITAGSDKTITGTVIVTGYSINGSFDGLIEASISFQGSTGGLTYATNG
jgi:predicted secreted protein